MSSHRPWMPLYIGDYLRDTRHLTTLQHGAYLLLIMEYWTKGRLPTTDTELRRICAMSGKQWGTNRQAIASMFELPDWRHSRIDRELQRVMELSIKRQVYGAKGGRISRNRNNAERFQVVNLPRSKS